MFVQLEPNVSKVYYIASRVMSKKVFVETGTLASIDYKYQNLVVIDEKNEEKTFKMSDYLQLVFPSYEEAQTFANKLPEVGQKVYYLRPRKKSITEETILYFDIPYIYFKSGNGVKVSQLGESVFLTKEQAIEALKK